MRLEASGSVVGHILELALDELHLLVGHAETFPVDQAFDCSQLINENQVWVISMEVNGIKICDQKLVVQVVGTLLVDVQAENSTQYLEQVFGDVVQVLIVRFQVRLYQQVLL